MTMYFAQPPKANQILKTCYSLAILTVVLTAACCCVLASGVGPGSDSSELAGRAPRQRTDQRTRQDTHPTTPGAPIEAGGAEGNHPRHHPSATNEAPGNHHSNHSNNNNININNNKLSKINPNAGAKSLEEDVRNVSEPPLAAAAAASAPESHQQQKQQQQQQQANEPAIRNGDGTTLRKETLHKLMSEKDLRRTFQVETHDEVPEYQVLKLTVSHDGSHLISPISDLGELLITTKQQSNTPQSDEGSSYPEQRADGNTRTSASGPEAAAFEAASVTGAAAEDQARSERVKRSAPASSPAQPAPIPEAAARQQPQPRAAHEDERLIVMNLSTFGRDFSLRLKRNADFQQRIKDMKMFLAESTGDGSLRYTEIKNPNFHQQHHKQEPHKRAASNDATELTDLREDSHQRQQVGGAETNATTGGSPPKEPRPTKDDNRPSATQLDAKAKQPDWYIGSTYHDEDNLAALLIERDRLTGQIKVDGTIGNDFVIKPMPRATIEALMATNKQRQSGESGQSAPASASPTNSNPNQASDSLRASETTSNALRGGASQMEQLLEQSSANELKQAAGHLHDDDPHDDDEMFLDEDEALELANLNLNLNLNQTNVASNSTAASLPQQQQQQQQQIRALSKAASERKWKKYRKLMAQTQVPKPSNMQQQQQQQRARRHANEQADVNTLRRGQAENHHSNQPETTNSSPQGFHMSHHIIYRQKPSSEASSSEHKHSFMLAPGQQSIEEMVRRFPAKRSTGDNSIGSSDGSSASRLSRDDLAEASSTDFAHDPLGGQFYLEPGSVTGFERAGHADWAFAFEQPSRRHAAPPPYALNNTGLVSFNSSTAASEQDDQQHLLMLDLQRRPSSGNATHHARYKRHLGSHRGINGSRSMPHHHHAPRPAASNRRHKRQAPDVVWPEVLLVVDYDSFLLHGGDSREVKRYFVSFWNGVDLRYKLLVNPHIRISLAGMIVAKDRDATPYLERNRLRAPNADAVDAAGALTDMGKYLYREDRLPTYDLAVVITKLDMCRRRYEGGRCNRGTAGFAYVGGACVVNKRLEKVNSVAIIEDSGGFSGIIVAAHEVGHLLGCVHDGSPPPSYLGGPGATHCPWEDGYIMSDLRHTERGFRWSQCSVEQFKHFLNGETATCLYNYPHESQMLHRLLPGSMLSLDDQCKRDRGTNACFKDARVCAQLFCFDSASGYCVSYRPAAEGSPCGEGQVCRNGKCVAEIENIIPDYTHQSQTVVAAGNRQRSLTAAGSSPGVVAAVAASGALVPPPPRLADNGLSASSTSTATSSPDATGALSGSGGSTSAKLVAGGHGGGTTTAGAQVSSRRMDTVQVDAPLGGGHLGPRTKSHLYQPIASQRNADEQQLQEGAHQSLPINYHQQQSLVPLQHHNYPRQTTTAAYKSPSTGLHLAGATTTKSHTKLVTPHSSMGGVQHQQQRNRQKLVELQRTAAYTDPYAYSSSTQAKQARVDPTTSLLMARTAGELYASSSSAMPRHSQAATRSSRRNYKQPTFSAFSAAAH